MQVSTVIGSGLLVNYEVTELFLTETTVQRASYMLELSSTARAAHTIGVAGSRPHVKCSLDHVSVEKQPSTQSRLCTINPYLDSTVYYINLFSI
jgi:hypothetical protein